MERIKLKLATREAKTPNQLRREGHVPATVYGPGADSESFQVCQTEFSRLPAAAYSHVIELESPKGSINSLIRNVQRKAIDGRVLNIEFYRVAADRKLTVQVPLKFVGISPAVQAGGLLVEMYDAAEIECLPADIPDYIEVDISAIQHVDGGIHFSQLKVSKEIKILNPAEEIVVRVVAKKAEKGAAAEPAAAAKGGKG